MTDTTNLQDLLRKLAAALRQPKPGLPNGSVAAKPVSIPAVPNPVSFRSATAIEEPNKNTPIGSSK